ncbi:phosphotransferase enzyme family protein [Ornithinibacillus sp. 179-J 7C1 HS]|uniref:phosphotransferase enzyme family protein n=1 Tax=Ornithinibacillus sp. 179-J 7C1 HS TaxID=3142384 RepID=UPI0039A38DF9
MERTVEAVFSQEIINKFLMAYELDNEYKLLGDFENYVYEVTKGDEAFILRITHSSHRSEEEIYGEIEWLNFLHENGANVSVVFSSINQYLVEKQVAEDETIFYACLFSKVKGNPIRSNDPKFNTTLFHSWGREIGKLHRITSEFQPQTGIRKQWFEDDLFEIEKYVSNEPIVIERTKEIISKLKQLPEENFGLIHNDVHNGNFFFDGKEIHIFDFDDACYFWHVSDIAIPLYYACTSLFPDESNQLQKAQFANEFITSFINGYAEEIQPPTNWKELLSLFLKVRDITLYSALNKKIAPKERNERIQGWMKQIKNRIEQSIPIVSINEGEEVYK